MPFDDTPVIVETILKTVEANINYCYPLTIDETINNLIFANPVKVSRQEVINIINHLLHDDKIIVHNGFLFTKENFNDDLAEHLMSTRNRMDTNLARAKQIAISELKYLKKLKNVKFIGYIASPYPENMYDFDLVVFTSAHNVWLVKALIEKFCLKKESEFNNNIYMIIDEFSYELKTNFLNLKKLAFIKPLYDTQEYNGAISDFYNKNLWIFDYIPFYPLHNMNFRFVSRGITQTKLRKPNVIHKSAALINKRIFENHLKNEPETHHTYNTYFVWNKGIR